MLPPRTSPGEAGGGRERGHTGQKKNTAQDTYWEAPTLAQTNKNHHTHPYINNHENDYTTHALSHSCISAINFRPRGTRIWQSAFCIAQHAHMTQESSCPGLKDELQKHKCSRAFFKEDPFGHPSLRIPFWHSHLFLPSIRSLKTHCGWLLFGFFLEKIHLIFESCPCTSNLPIHAYSNQILVRTKGQHT